MEGRIEELVKSYFEKKGLPWRPALTFSDVSIITKFSDVSRRSDLNNFRVNLSKNFVLNIPVVSANMEDVTGAKMAIALARLGGLGFIHQFFPIEERVRRVEKVKRADNALIENPVKILDTANFSEAKQLMKTYDVSSVLVVDCYNNLLGIITSRDYRFKNDDFLPVRSVMKPMPLVVAGLNISREEAEEVLDRLKIEKLPLVDDKNKLAGLITARDMLKEKEFPNALRDKKGRLCVGAAVGVSGNYLSEAEKLLAAGADVILVDTARAGSVVAAEAVRAIREKFPEAVIAVGNIDNPEHVPILVKVGADCIKIGVGPGARCKTRVVAGVGAPQIYAVSACSAIAKQLGVSIIADGGIRDSGDFAKALVAGADAVMIGSLLAGTDEAPGLLIRKENRLEKQYRGSASREYQSERKQRGTLGEIKNPEGESAPVPYAGSVSDVIGGLIDGIRSSMSYVGARNLKEYWERTEFLWISNGGYEEGKPRI